jgi:hypothetical protein
MDGFDGVSHQLFKLCAKLVQCEKRFDYRSLPLGPKVPLNRAPHLKFAIRSILVRRTIFEQEIEATVGTAPLQGAITQKMRSKTGFPQAPRRSLAGMSIASFVCWSMKTAVRRIIEAMPGRDQRTRSEPPHRGCLAQSMTQMSKAPRQNHFRQRHDGACFDEGADLSLRKCGGCREIGRSNYAIEQRKLECHI